MKVEMLYTPGCPECIAAHAKLRSAAQEAVKDLEWREVNVLDHLDHAVELGVMTSLRSSSTGSSCSRRCRRQRSCVTH